MPQAEFYPRKVFRCPCLALFINEIFNTDVREYSQILKAILCYKKMPEHVFNARIEKNVI